MKRQAFTLIEVVLSLSLLVALAGVMFGAFRGIATGRDRVESKGAALAGASMLVERVEQSLFSAVAGAPGQGSGVVGTPTSLRVLSRGVYPVEPATYVGMQDLQQIAFDFDPSGRSVTMARGPATSGAGQSGIIASEVERLEFAYYTGEQWVENFDSGSTGALPVAVQVSIWFTRGPATEPTEPADLRGTGGEPDEDTDDLALDSSFEAEPDEETQPARQPDISRIIIVPDGPVSAWKEGA